MRCAEILGRAGQQPVTPVGDVNSRDSDKRARAPAWMRSLASATSARRPCGSRRPFDETVHADKAHMFRNMHLLKAPLFRKVD